jgi:hypothetical protein
MHGNFTDISSVGNAFHRIAAHRAACTVRDAAGVEYDNSDEDEACPATQMAMDHMHRTIDVEQGLLEELMSTTPMSVGCGDGRHGPVR